MSLNLSPEEKSLYPMIGYGLLWGPLYVIGQRWLGPLVGPAVTGFVWLMGFWLLPAIRPRRFSFAAWCCLSVAVVVTTLVVRWGIDRGFGQS